MLLFNFSTHRKVSFKVLCSYPFSQLSSQIISDLFVLRICLFQTFRMKRIIGCAVFYGDLSIHMIDSFAFHLYYKSWLLKVSYDWVRQVQKTSVSSAIKHNRVTGARSTYIPATLHLCVCATGGGLWKLSDNFVLSQSMAK